MLGWLVDSVCVWYIRLCVLFLKCVCRFVSCVWLVVMVWWCRFVNSCFLSYGVVGGNSIVNVIVDVSIDSMSVSELFMKLVGL